jgi:hypothetical protein
VFAGAHAFLGAIRGKTLIAIQVFLYCSATFATAYSLEHSIQII